ncbi:Alpha/beta hydrolase family protein [Rubripirellula obstinata]|uniref:Alpha/beta hydrolase family protein n=1 Tax=Rubripirellula obstinata TaxID=406547 RepID=A0A5B1CHR0_9BACT|nr:alpha/beta fold hydrolase [Rubripirellula obstinata]KAA1259110.1 Alpha/beta hydrolase family protein [Rubripirellula obstinata]
MSRKSYRVTFPGSMGFPLAGIVDRPDPIESATPVLVLSHCFTCNKDLKAIVRISRGLADRGIAVLRYDMTGLGGSGGDFSRTSFTSNLNDLRTAIEFASNEIGVVTGLMGHSFGGAASMAFAGENSDSTPKPKALITLAAPSDTSHLATLLDAMNPAIKTDGVGDVDIGGYVWTIRDTMTADFRSHDLPALISQIEIPTLIFQSPDDTTVSYDHALRIASLLKNHGSIISLPGADHLLSAQPDIELVTATTAAFLIRYSG